jgi:TonB family protein
LEYTAEAKRAKIEGVVWVECVISASGVCSEAKVIRPLDFDAWGLDQRALETSRQYRFKPTSKAGVPVAFTAAIELKFSLADESR